MECPIKYIVRQMKNEDFEEVMRVCTEVHLDLSIFNLKIGYNLDPKGFVVAQDLNSGEIIGTCAGIKLSQNFAIITSYAVKSKYQNMGIGSSIWDHVIKHIGKETNISLMAFEPMFTKYCTRFGSVIIDDRSRIDYTGVHNLIKYELLVNQIKNVSIVRLNDENLKSFAVYDKSVCGFDRESLFREAVKHTDKVIIGAFDDNNKQIIGYCILVLCDWINNYVSAQPLYANNTEIAELLLSKGCTEMLPFKSEGLAIYSWESNVYMQSIGVKIGLTKGRVDVERLYTKMIAHCNFDKIFGRMSPYVSPF